MATTWTGLWERMRASVGTPGEGATGWTSRLHALYEQAQATIAPKVQADPQAAAADVQRMMLGLARWAQADREAMEIASRLPYGAARDAAIRRIAESQRRWAALAAPFWAQSSVADDVVGVAPLLVIAGVALTAGAVAWGVASWRDVALGAQAAESYREYLEAHAAALAKGQPAPPPPAAPTVVQDPLQRLGHAAASAGSALIGVLVAGAAVATGVAVVSRLARSR